MSSRRLAGQVVAALASNKLAEREAVVTAVHEGPPRTVDITLAGDRILGCRYLDSYTPAAGDVVRILKDGPDLLILGKLA